MFFSGDPSARKRVDLGGRSNKERDRKVLLDQTREERRRRQALRLQNSSATKIQVCPQLAPRLGLVGASAASDAAPCMIKVVFRELCAL
jgi:hypothetical protein